MSGEGEGGGGGKLPSVDHGRRTDKGRDKKDSTDEGRAKSMQLKELYSQSQTQQVSKLHFLVWAPNPFSRVYFPDIMLHLILNN